MLQALKRMAAGGELDKLHYIPGFSDPVRLITPINSDRRYKQYTEIKVPASNAVIFFARDGSASMDQYKCDIVSDMSWWIDAWIRHFYERVERCYIWHDTVAQEVDEETFYRYRYGGGTKCSRIQCWLLLIFLIHETGFIRHSCYWSWRNWPQYRLQVKSNQAGTQSGGFGRSDELAHGFPGRCRYAGSFW